MGGGVCSELRSCYCILGWVIEREDFVLKKIKIIVYIYRFIIIYGFRYLFRVLGCMY